MSAIKDGTYPVDSLLPSEPDLAQSLGVSRSTVRAALNELQTLGMITRKPSAGTRIIAKTPVDKTAGYNHYIDSIDSLIEYAAATPRTIQSVGDIVTDKTKSSHLGVGLGSKWLHIAHSRQNKNTQDNHVFCWTDVFIAYQYKDIVLRDLECNHGALSVLIEAASGRRIMQIEQTIKAIYMPEHLAVFFGVDKASPALEIRRRYFLSAQDLVQVSVSIYPADRYEYTTRLVHNQ